MNRAQSITNAWIPPNKFASIALPTAKKETEALDMGDISDGFAKRLRSLRKQKNLPQTELGKLAGLHYTHIKTPCAVGRASACWAWPSASRRRAFRR